MVSNQRLRLPRAPFRRRLLVTAFGLAGILGVAPLYAATLTVTTSADNTTVDGQCTLREAILANNAGADSADCVADVTNPWGTADTIAFNIPGAGLHTIQPSVALPANTRTVRIDGYTQPGALMNTLGVSMTYPDAHGLDTQIMIELDGSLIGGGFPVLALNANDSRVAGLSIFNNSFESIQANSSNNLISGNFIGVRADGTTAAGGVYGVVLNASNNTIGNGIYGPNLIAGNGTNVFINNVHGNLVLGNLIGTDRTGTVGLCGGLCDGVSIRGSSGTATSNAVHNNVISGLPGYGIALSGTSNTGISGNAIGIAVGGAALGNMGGVRIASSAGGTTVGTWFDNNGIANSTAFDGIMVEGVAPYGDPSGTNIDVTNVFWNNAGLGINLRPIGEAAGTVTANDALDADSGPNGLQNFPVIASAQVNGTGGVDIVFSLNSAVNTMYGIRGYANPSCDPSGYGEGRFPASDAGNYPTTDGSGNTGGTLTVPAPLPAGWGVGQFVTLTARNTGTSTSSEFSACVQIAAASGVPPVMGNVPDQVATVGTPFSLDLSGYVTLTVNPIIAGGYVIASGALPPGLTLNADSGVISGTPSAAGTYNVTVTASDSDGASNADAVQFVVSAALGIAPAITSGAPPNGVVGSPYNFTVTANGTAPIAFSGLGTLPAGLAIDANSGVISGTPITPGNYNVIIRASNGILPNVDGYYSVTVSTSPVTSYTGPTATGAGNATASFSGGGAGCTYTKSVFIALSGGAGSPPAGSEPAGYVFPFGLFDFAVGNCTPGATISMTITYPQVVPAGAVYWKYGPTAGDPTPHWYQLPATIAGNTATFSITDGGLGDDDLDVNGTIVDQGGPGVPGAPGGVAAIPTLSEWGMILLAGMLGLFGMGVMRRRTSKSGPATRPSRVDEVSTPW
jgi:CSLREA domain-containing protein